MSGNNKTPYFILVILNSNLRAVVREKRLNALNMFKNQMEEEADNSNFL